MRKKVIFLSISLLLTIIFTIAVMTVDVTKSGLLGSRLGFSSLNLSFFAHFGENTSFYKISEFLGYFLVLYPVFYIGYIIYSWRKNKSLYLVEPRLLLIISVYIVTALFYLLFEKIPINYRPIFIDNAMESSFPSSHTMLALVICGTSMIITNFLFPKKSERSAVIAVNLITMLLAITIVVFRAFSGAHWFTDIIGGILYAAMIVSAYAVGVEALTFPPKKKKIARARRASDLHKTLHK